MRLVTDRFLTEVLRRSCHTLQDASSGDLPSLEISDFCSAKVSTAEIGIVMRLEESGFRTVDVNLLFEKPCGNGRKVEDCRLAVPADEERVARIARESFRFSRFHLDPRFTNEDAGLVKEAWVRNYFRGCRGDALFVIEYEGKIAGFLQMLGYQTPCATIDLVAVDDVYARRGIASALIEGVVSAPHLQSVVVGTQAANVPSVRLYEKLGFRLRESAYVLHRHRR